jgi:hypothetical protein
VSVPQISLKDYSAEVLALAGMIGKTIPSDNPLYALQIAAGIARQCDQRNCELRENFRLEQDLLKD